MKKLGILIDKFNSTPQMHINMLLNLNQLITSNPSYSAIVFAGESSEYIDKPQFATMEWVNAWSFDGLMISTNIITTQVSLECPKISKRLLYIYNLEWYYNHGIMWSRLSNIYQNDKIDLIARTPYHAQIIEQCWKKPKYIMDDFDYPILEKIINENL